MGKTKEKDYEAIAKRKITQPSKMKTKWRFLVYSRNKKGKTRFCLSADEQVASGKLAGKLLVVDPETGTDKYISRDPHVWPVAKWEDLDEVWGYLRKGNHAYEWVALDGMTRLNNMALRYIMKLGEEANLDRRPGIVDRRDYNKSGELLKELILKFDRLPMGVIYTAQERLLTVEENEDETSEASAFYIPDLPQGVRGALNSNVDVIGRLYVVKATFKDPKRRGETIEKNQRRLWIGLHPQYDTGGRSEYDLPDVVKNPTVPKLIKLCLEGKE